MSCLGPGPDSRGQAQCYGYLSVRRRTAGRRSRGLRRYLYAYREWPRTRLHLLSPPEATPARLADRHATLGQAAHLYGSIFPVCLVYFRLTLCAEYMTDICLAQDRHFYYAIGGDVIKCDDYSDCLASLFLSRVCQKSWGSQIIQRCRGAIEMAK